jgi:hypothetical protein
MPASVHVVLAEHHARLGELTERLIGSLGHRVSRATTELREKPMFLEDLAELLDGS